MKTSKNSIYYALNPSRFLFRLEKIEHGYLDKKCNCGETLYTNYEMTMNLAQNTYSEIIYLTLTLKPT